MKSVSPRLVAEPAGYLRPSRLSDALAFVADTNAECLAGGTDVFPARTVAAAWKGQPTRPLLDLSGVPELRGIQTNSDRIRIGATTTWTSLVRELEGHALAALRAAAGQIGGVQVQNRGTIGGNLCNASPAADGVPPLLALNAMVELVSRRGTRTMPLAQFLLGARRTLLDADEIMSAIIIPAPSPTLRTTFCKLGARQHLVISIAMMAIGLDCQAGRIVDARIAVGACSATALRLTDLEFDLKRCSISDDLADLPSSRHLASLAPIDDVRGTVSYRKAAVLELLRRALPALAKASHTRGMQ